MLKGCIDSNRYQYN